MLIYDMEDEHFWRGALKPFKVEFLGAIVSWEEQIMLGEFNIFDIISEVIENQKNCFRDL
jgi:hypothetical protein